MDIQAGQSRWIETFDSLARRQSVAAWGIARAQPLPLHVVDTMERWVQAGHHADMDYLSRHVRLKANTGNVLSGCQSVISLAFPYPSKIETSPGACVVSRHAVSDDYHNVLRRQLPALCRFIEETMGGKTRVCVDSAPVAERFWAAQCGVGTPGRNGLLYVPGYGSWVFLAEILTTARLPERNGGAGESTHSLCGDCDRCQRHCPGRALAGDGTLDSRRCRAYLTIECRAEQLPPDVKLGRRIYGCDICQEVCPLNEGVDARDTCFTPREELLWLTADKITSLTPGEFSDLTRGTSMERIALWQLRRNLRSQ